MASEAAMDYDLRQRGYKLTRQRREILRIMAESPRLLTAEELLSGVKKVHPSVSLSTIYRNLDHLSKLGVIARLDLGDGQGRYNLQLSGGHRHHCVCLGCGYVNEVPCPVYEARDPDDGFVVTGHRFEIYGYCSTCCTHAAPSAEAQTEKRRP